MHDFKYGRQVHLRHVLAGWLGEAFEDPRLAGRRFDFIVPVPLHPTRKRERGFNQAELLARALNRATGIRLHRALQRTRYTTTQTQFDRAERMENLKGAFRLRRGSNVQDLRVLLVDDHRLVRAGVRALLSRMAGIEVIAPAVARLRAEGLEVSGPFPADSLFARAARGEFDAVIAQYHDQGLIPVKLAAFGHAVNVTIGLPFVRTSVDHGTGFDIVEKGVAEEGSLLAALRVAADMVAARR